MRKTLAERAAEAEERQKNCNHSSWHPGGATIYQDSHWWDGSEICDNCGLSRYINEGIYRQRIETGDDKP